MEEHLRFGGGLGRAVVDAAQIERPGSRKDRAAQRYLVADFPAVLFGELAADDRALAVGQECLPLLGREDELGIDLQVRGWIDRELREEIALAHVDPAEPVRPGNRGHAVDLADLLDIGQRQGKHQRHGVTGDEPRAGARVGAGIPRVDDGTQQTERRDRDHDAHDREGRAELVPQRVLEDEAKDVHDPYQRVSLPHAGQPAATGSAV